MASTNGGVKNRLLSTPVFKEIQKTQATAKLAEEAKTRMLTKGANASAAIASGGATADAQILNNIGKRLGSPTNKSGSLGG